MLKRYVSIFASVLLAITFLLPVTSSVALANTDDQQYHTSIKDTNSKRVPDAIKKVTDYILSQPVLSEWQAVGLAKAGVAVPSSYDAEFNKNVQEQIIEMSKANRLKITDAERLVIAAVATGKDPKHMNGFDLLDAIYNSIDINKVDTMLRQGTNGLIFALIALDTKNFTIPKDARWNREEIVAELLKYQREDGAWSLSASSMGDVNYDMTAMALIGLAPYTNQTAVKQAVDKAVNFLSENQGPTGGFNEVSVGGISSEATSQVIIGLTANKIDPQDEMFTKNGINLIDHLLSFQTENGGFKHTASGSTDTMATEQALQGLVAFKLFQNNEGSLYDFNKSQVNPDPEPTPTPTPTPTPQFTDVTGHWAKAYINQAVEQGIASGYKDNTFKPNQSLTRAQAVSIIVRALDLKTDKNAPFLDTQNYAESTQAQIAAAYHNGIVNGKDGKFMPAQKVTRAQMALMLYRAYEVKNGEAYKIKQVAPFHDIHSYNMEAIQAMTMLYDLKMAKGENGNFMPNNSTSRAHAVKMLIEFLNTK